jgi:hypothetical protein
LLDLVALGTVADVAQLKGLNRAFVTQGLKVMAQRHNIGLAALADAARLNRAPTSTDLGFALGPRINAGGRVGKSDLGVRLLTTEDPEEAASIRPSSTGSTRKGGRSRRRYASRPRRWSRPRPTAPSSWSRRRAGTPA